MITLSKAINRLNETLIKLLVAFFTELEQKKIFFLFWDTKDPELPKQSWERKVDLEETGSLSSN